MDERLCAYVRAVAHFLTAVKEASVAIQLVPVTWTFYPKTSANLSVKLCEQFKWRNGWFYSLAEKAMTKKFSFRIHSLKYILNCI